MAKTYTSDEVAYLMAVADKRARLDEKQDQQTQLENINEAVKMKFDVFDRARNHEVATEIAEVLRLLNEQAEILQGEREKEIKEQTQDLAQSDYIQSYL